MTKISLSIPIAAALIPGVAAAHPEHVSSGAFGFAHYLTDPFHVGLTGAAIVLFIAASRALSRRLSTKLRTH